MFRSSQDSKNSRRTRTTKWRTSRDVLRREKEDSLSRFQENTILELSVLLFEETLDFDWNDCWVSLLFGSKVLRQEKVGVSLDAAAANQWRRVQRLLLVLIFVCPQTSSSQVSSKIEGFQMNSCVKSSCLLFLFFCQWRRIRRSRQHKRRLFIFKQHFDDDIIIFWRRNILWQKIPKTWPKMESLFFSFSVEWFQSLFLFDDDEKISFDHDHHDIGLSGMHACMHFLLSTKKETFLDNFLDWTLFSRQEFLSFFFSSDKSLAPQILLEFLLLFSVDKQAWKRDFKKRLKRRWRVFKKKIMKKDLSSTSRREASSSFPPRRSSSR